MNLTLDIMYFNQYKFKYLEWNSPDQIHEITMNWISELNFIQDEQVFLNDIFKEFTTALLSSSELSTLQEKASQLSTLEKELPKLMKLVTKHRNNLKVLVDGKDELKKERAFQDRHLLLRLKMNDYIKGYKTLKSEIFQLISKAKKAKKQKKILN